MSDAHELPADEQKPVTLSEYELSRVFLADSSELHSRHINAQEKRDTFSMNTSRSDSTTISDDPRDNEDAIFVRSTTHCISRVPACAPLYRVLSGAPEPSASTPTATTTAANVPAGTPSLTLPCTPSPNGFSLRNTPVLDHSQHFSRSLTSEEAQIYVAPEVLTAAKADVNAATHSLPLSPILCDTAAGESNAKRRKSAYMAPALQPLQHLSTTPKLPSHRAATAIKSSDVIAMVTLFLDEAASQPCRSLVSFLGSYPSTPRIDEYRLRMCVNLLYYAKNYANCVVVIALLTCVWYPCFIALVIYIAAARVVNRMSPHHHSTTTMTSPPPSVSLAKRLLRATEFATAVLLLNYVGVSVTVCVIVSFCLPVGAHALFMPFSDAAYENYVTIMQKRDIPVAVPRSPTEGLNTVDPSFEAALSSSTCGLKSSLMVSD